MENILEVKNVTKIFGSGIGNALKLLKAGSNKKDIFKRFGTTVGTDNVSFDVKKGEIFVIIGLSGSGKSTIIRCLNMLHHPTSGEILFNGKDICKFNKNELREYRRNHISMVFQHFGLISNRTVLGNVTYGLEVKGIPKAEREAKAEEMLSLVGLEGWANHNISSLSGGMRQRVGIARALTNDPDILLMDEPFSALDPIVRRDMQFELLKIHKMVQKTIIFITHDINEAFKIGDRVAIMKDGKIVQIGTPEEILEQPVNEYVEEFVKDIDKTKILCVKHVMTVPSAFVKQSDGPNVAMKEMKSNGVSSVYVVGDNMRLVGLLTLDGALKARNGEVPLKDVIIKDIPVTNSEVNLQDLLPIAAEAKYPIAVTNQKNQLIGIVTKASVLSSLA
ncbi:glycine betaine/L-proline ABC transporter ATP-binding protein [Anaerocolumna aminovalerica]|uniref:Quaternary amine transport ATP-binding protein n=1 Tax=Anaerocolumna aminovalerica TaxID=1527 RepID=A0A1I5FHU7_9FIRM|nr:glycine betaine/L-proline ABC transporter ATP-binding protein [Anaerocolumna aminovalerica]MBU5334102.1 glycine betaine/L-proline ABC transporter ATP-binding protein [Anaerocolumna aminovalerica]MDU6264723.1 glycine betaine/L-proline ABC transporter ATP-binding protein [Anaerocolumna aminovalerica]SFO23310.1 glycine betaine/proline transport system ATP-binding protein [Anaerocolumna aminovalerica]